MLPPITGIQVSAEVLASNYFSDTYHEARTKFLTAAKAAGGNLEYYRHPFLGADSEELYIAVATFKLSGARSVLVLGCGTHGVAGCAGSAIQVAQRCRPPLLPRTQSLRLLTSAPLQRR